MFDLILIDFSWLYNRYFFIAKTRPLHSKDTKEEVSREVYRMLFQFLSIAGRAHPSAKFLLALDPPTGTLKNSLIYENYKGNRDKATKKEVYASFKEVVLKLSQNLDSRFTFARALEYEADQVIAYLCEKYHTKHQILIYSGDKDLLQLTALENVFSSDKFEKGMFLLRTDKDIFNKFKNSKGEDFTRISTNKRDILKYRTLKGDPSDNIPPVFPRIKDKEIVFIIKEYWTGNTEYPLSIEMIDDIINNIKGDNPVLAEKLNESKDNWYRNYKIMNLFGLTNLNIKKVKRN